MSIPVSRASIPHPISCSVTKVQMQQELLANPKLSLNDLPHIELPTYAQDVNSSIYSALPSSSAAFFAEFAANSSTTFPVTESSSRIIPSVISNNAPAHRTKGNAGSNSSNSLNHLLKFSYTPRSTTLSAADAERNARHARNLKSFDHKRNHNLANSQVLFNKELYILSNCQFVVHDLGSQEANSFAYSIYNLDPDRPIDWSLIEFIRFFTNDQLSCPICLFPPTAAKMTRCGHIYCHSCLLHYFSLCESKNKSTPLSNVSRPCPICFELIRGEDLRSVELELQHEYKANENLTMYLTRRSRGSLLPQELRQLKNSSTSTPTLPSIVARLTSKSDFSENKHVKLLIADPQMIIDLVLSRERQELEITLTDLAPTLDEEEIYYLRFALSELNNRELNLLAPTVKAVRSTSHRSSGSADSSVGGTPVFLSPLSALPSSSTHLYSVAPSSASASANTNHNSSGSSSSSMRSVLRNQPKKVYRSAFDEQEEMMAAQLDAKQDRACDLACSDEEHELVDQDLDLQDEHYSEHGSMSPPPVDHDTLSISGSSHSMASGNLRAEGHASALKKDTSVPELARSSTQIIPNLNTVHSNNSELDPNATRSKALENQSHDEDPNSFYYFYQAADGQPIYLHPLNVRCLVAHYARKGVDTAESCSTPELARCPIEISGRIVQLESVVLTPQLRKRQRYLSHLPLGKQILIAELALGPPPAGSGFVCKRVLDSFSKDFDMRRKERQSRKRAEKQVEMRVRKKQEQELSQLGFSNSLPVDTPEQFPAIQCEDRVAPVIGRRPGSGSSSSQSESSPTEALAELRTPTGSPASDPAQAGSLSAQGVWKKSAQSSASTPTFAQMVRAINVQEANAGSHSWIKRPVAQPLPGQRASGDPEGIADAGLKDPVGDQVEGGLDRDAPRSLFSLGDAFTRALESLEHEDTTNTYGKENGKSEQTSGSTGKKGKGKKKERGTLLFSTQMHRN